ncbi:hypothetical protein [Pedobacter sp. GR22-10]|uniref:hypothetical protein n=1 Tax=Pedobacter sp. GR22-10 TaxID=2994472 RepID=UPI002246EF31|nr:hypothetical protein [Pedobacter sp. GR22-10]MCX2430660.1 hypothetical protein [Pedobacter sp. GR22-10]
MDILNFSNTVLQSNSEELIEFVAKNRQEIKFMFVNAGTEGEVRKELHSILVYLTELQEIAIPPELYYPEIQFLYFELGLYFKRCNVHGPVSTCKNKIENPILKARLNAWLHYHLYIDPASEIKFLFRYLSKLSEAISDGEENYENDVIRDLDIYYKEAIDHISRLGTPGQMNEFISVFDSQELEEMFPILCFYKENKEQFNLGFEIIPPAPRIYQPTNFSDQLFREKFADYIRHDLRTTWYSILLGIRQDRIRPLIGFGQTDFDREVPGLQGLDIVKLYAHANMRMHFFSAIYLFEKLDVFVTLHNSPGIIKFIDIGCGPATAGLALIEHIHEATGNKVSFDYFGVDWFQKMREGAEYFLQTDIYEPVNLPTFVQTLAGINLELMEAANSIIFNASFLFASEYLNVDDLIKEVLTIRRSKPDVPCYFVFQNSIESSNNIKWDEFKKNIGPHKLIDTAKPRILYNTQRGNFNPTQQIVYQELLLIY